MSSAVSQTIPSYTITQTEKGWLLSIENEHCSVVQIFRSASAARLAVDRMVDFLETMSTQAPRQAA
jgi:hypothetical protein